MVQINVEKELAALIAPTQDRFTGMRYGQGTILSWNPDTFENEIDFRGITLTNVAVLSGPDALTYKEGDVVGLMGWAPAGGFGSWWILGRVITPGPGAGEAAIDFLASSLGAAVSAGVIGERVHFDENPNNGDVNYPSAGFVDPDSGDPGPTLVDVGISEAGRAIVTVGAVFAPGTPSSGIVAAYMGFDVSGASSLGPSINRSVKSIVDASGTTFGLDLSRSELITGLNPGLHTFTAKYQANVVSGTPPAFARWDDRYIQVIAF